MLAVWLSDINLSPFVVAQCLFHITLTCLAVAVSARWWSGLVVAPLPSLLLLIGDSAFEGFFVRSSLVFGMPTAAVAAFVFRQTTEPPGFELEDRTRIGAFVAAVVAFLVAVLVLVLSY